MRGGDRVAPSGMSLEEIAAIRHDYSRAGLDAADLTSDPGELFARWYADAAVLPEPNAMVVSTVSPDGWPEARYVLFKGLDDRGFRFFTNLDSAKGQALAAESRCALLFPWHPLERQVRIGGRAELLPRAVVDDYFASRPRASRIGAWASPQSQETTEEQLRAAYADADARFGDEVPAPDRWGGFVVVPEAIEFWQGRPGRMHDRWRYRRTADTSGGWDVVRLAP